MNIELDYLIHEQLKREREQNRPRYQEAIIIDEYPVPPPSPKQEERVCYEC